jgi:hypothetical protein
MIPRALDARRGKHELERFLHVARLLKAAAGKQTEARLLLHRKQHGRWKTPMHEVSGGGGGGRGDLSTCG